MTAPEHGPDTYPAAIEAIDLAALIDGSAVDRRRIAARVDAICRSLGFLIIRNHGVPADTIAHAWDAARTFFALPVELKLQSRPRDSGSPRGYFPMESETLARTLAVDTPPDTKESFSSGPLQAPDGVECLAHGDFFYGPNVWPAEPPGFEAAWTAYYRTMEILGARVMQLFAGALRLDADYFAPLHARHISALRTLSYPPTTGEPLPGQRAAGEHSDYGSVTILKPDPAVAGLEIRLPDGRWIAAPLIRDAFLVNIGDMMARWTNDRWVSTMHRVTAGDSGRTRQSIAYFMNPDADAEVRCLPGCIEAGSAPRYAPVLAGEYLMQKFRSTL